MLAWALGRWLGISPLEQLSLNGGAVARGCLATIPMLLGLWWVLTTSWPPARQLVDLVAEQLGPLLAGRSTVQLGLLAVLAGVAEETLFRGVLQTGLSRVMPEVWALIGASAIFGLAHFASKAYAAFAGVIGLYLGGLFLLEDNLLAPAVTHALYDFVALLHVSRTSRLRGTLSRIDPE